MASSGLKCLSHLCACILVLVNCLAILFAIVLLAFGIVLTFGINWVLENSTVKDALNKLPDLKDFNLVELIGSLRTITGSVGITFIVIGAVLILIACLGCCGSCCKNKTCLIIYAAVVGTIFLAQLTVVIIWYADSNILKSAAKDAMGRSVRSYRGLRSTNVESLVQNIVQIFAGCCGVNNGSDFDSVNWDREFPILVGGRNTSFNLTYPATCCKYSFTTMQPLDEICLYNNTFNSNHMKGCYNEVFTLVDMYFLNYIFAGLAGNLGLQLLLVAGALVIFCAQSDDSQMPRSRVRRVKPL